MNDSHPPSDETSRTTALARRSFLQQAGRLAACALLAPYADASPGPRIGGPGPRTKPAAARSSRASRVFETRVRAAAFERDAGAAAQNGNGDETRYPELWSSYTKGLPHNDLGLVAPVAYRAYRKAIDSGDARDYEQIPLGGYLKLANPQAAYGIDLIGPDSSQMTIPMAPRLASAELAGEIAELYWHAVLRDVPFADYEKDPLVERACAELSAMSDFRGPKARGRVTPELLFRGISSLAAKGPYISQFFLRDIPLSPIRVPQKIRTAAPGRDFMTDPDAWLRIQNGQLAGVNTFDDTPRYIRNGRDLGEYVHRDFTYQAALCASMILLKMSAPLDGGLPSQYSITQGGFVTCGPPDIFHHVATVANLALKATWYQKWLVHRRARPEEIGGRLHWHIAGKREVAFHRDILDASVLATIRSQHGSTLLPQAFPEGCPSHPSYPAAHAVIAGACATVLKAFFNESWVLPAPVVASRDGSVLEPYHGGELTVGGELDKLAENVAIGRNFAGVHWRSDGVEGLRLGEAFAIRYLQEAKLASPDLFTGFGLAKFDGSRITV